MQKRKHFPSQIDAYSNDIVRLEEMSKDLSKAQIVTVESGSGDKAQVKVLYDYEGNGVSVKKGQVDA